MGIDNIRDEGSLLVWLEDQDDYAASVTIAARAALRVQPIFWERLAPVDGFGEQTPLSNFWFVLLPAVAAALPSFNASRDAAPAHRDPLARRMAEAVAPFPAASAAASAAVNAQSAAHEGRGWGNLALDYANAGTRAAVAAAREASNTHLLLTEIRGDASCLLQGAPVWKQSLWTSAPVRVAEAWESTYREWTASPEPWPVFAEIYRRFWHGREPDWAYLKQIVLIDPEIWKAGPEAVAEAIARIEEQMRLLAEVEWLRVRVEDLSSVVPADAGTRSDNLPEGMEPLDASAEVARQMAQLRAALSEAQRALAKPKPERRELERAAASFLTLRNGLLAIGAAACIGFWGRAGGWLFEELILNGRLEALARQIQALAAGL